MLKFITSMSVFMALAGIPIVSVAQVNPVKPVSDTLTETLREDAITDNLPVVSLDENDMQDGSAQNVSSQLSAGRDPFLNAATFKFSAARFRIRGYDADMFGTYINGIPMENLDNGFTPYGLWGGLNDVLRSRDVAHGMRAVPYAFGEFGGFTFIDTRASYQRAQSSFNYAISNRNYAHRIMLTKSTGLNKKGWAFSVSGSRRWADEGYADGTFYNGWSFFGGVDKRINNRQLVSFVFFATPTESGRAGASVREMLDIAGTNFYNPYWGYQNGKKRNSSVAKTFQPIGILSHDWKITDKMSLFTAASFSTGTRSTTGLDWYNAPDPRPDYYRYLPSYQEDPAMAALVLQNLQTDVNQRQINWDKLYQSNYNSFESISNANGILGNTVSGRRSHYILEERIIKTTRYNFSSTLNTALKPNIDFTAGITYQAQNNSYYKKVNDLLGGDFYVDINQFAERDFPESPNALQNDVNNPNRILKTGDKFGYNYNINIRKAAAWAQANFKFRRIDFFLAAEHSYTRFWRVGNVKTGVFPANSFGKSKPLDFYNYSFKGGLTYKLNGRNYFFANGGYQTRAPFFENVFIAPRTRDFIQGNTTNEKILSFEGGYLMNAPRVKLRASGYFTQFKDQMNVLTFYHDQYRNFVNYAISNIGKIHTGVELGAEVNIYKGLSANAAASIGKFFFNTRQLATVTIDNSSSLVDKDVTVFSNNFRVPTPQEAYTIGLDYRSPKFWFININLNYFRNMWMDFNPIRRTTAAVEGLDPKGETFNSIVGQERMPNQYTVDAFAGYSWMMSRKFKSMKKRTYLVFNLGVNNLLDNRSVVSGGFEQLRFDYEERDINKFPSRRFYSFGINFFASVGLRF